MHKLNCKTESGQSPISHDDVMQQLWEWADQNTMLARPTHAGPTTVKKSEPAMSTAARPWWKKFWSK